MNYFSARVSVRIIALLILSTVSIAFGQVVTATISGTVKDGTGAVVPAAQVVLLNEDTGTSRTVQSDTAGRYSASSLTLGKYRVTVTAQGFQTVARTGIELAVGQEAVVDVALTVGAVTQTIEVAGEAPMVETTNATVSGLVNQEQIRDLPLNGRSYADLALLTPGVLYNRTTGSSPADGFGQRLSVHGSRNDANLYLLDGTVMNDASGNTAGVAQLSLGIEGIREFRVLTHNFSAEYGRNSGGVVSLVTRSGTNQFHGSLYEFFRNNVLDARDFFNPGALPAFRRNQFGAALGGPIKKDRIFFFSNYEGLRQVQGSTLISTVPDNNARAGFLPCKVATTTLCNTATQLANVQVNPAMAKYLAVYPVPNGRVYGDGTAQNISDNSRPTNEDYYLERADFHLSDKDSAYVRYVYDDGFDLRPRPFAIFVIPTTSTSHFALLSETHVFSGTKLNDFRFGFNRLVRDSVGNATIPALDEAPYIFEPGTPFGKLTFSAGTGTGPGGAGK